MKRSDPSQSAQVIATHITWLAVHGNLCLALRHPANRGPSRSFVVEFTRSLGRMLVTWGVITEEELKAVEHLEVEKGSEDLG